MVTDDIWALFHLYTCGNRELREIVAMRAADERVALDLFLIHARLRCESEIEASLRHWVCTHTVHVLHGKLRAICDGAAKEIGVTDLTARKVWGERWGLKHAKTNVVASAVNKQRWLTQMYSTISDTCTLHEARWELYVQLIKMCEE